MFELITGDSNGNAKRWNGGGDIRLEYRSNNLDDQHEYGRNLQRNGNGYEGLHGIGYWYTHGGSEPDGLSEQSDGMFDLITGDSNGDHRAAGPAHRPLHGARARRPRQSARARPVHTA